MRRVFLMILLVFTSVSLFGQKEKKYARQGNSLFKEGDFQNAEVEYKRALEKNPLSQGVIYNLGNTMYRQNKIEDAVKTVSQVVDSVQVPSLKSDIFHNLGNYNLAQKKYQEAIDSYKNSLRIRPDDYETKSNLAYAQKMMEKDKNKDQNKNDNKDNKDNKNNPQDNKQNKDNDKDKSNPDQQQQINKENADQMLQAIQNKENQTQDKVNKEKAKMLQKYQPDKNW